MLRIAVCLLSITAAACMDASPTGSGKRVGLIDAGRSISIVDGGEELDPPGPLVPGQERGIAPLYPDKGGSPAPKKDQYVPPAPKPDVGTPGVTLTAAEKDLMDAVNAARVKLGLNALAIDPILLCAARKAAQVCHSSGSCGHVGSDGSWPNDRAQSCGMNAQAAWKVNEIAAGPGFTDGADAVWGWSQSSGHWWGLTHPQATKIGVGATGDGCYWAVFDCCIAGS